MHSSSLQVWPSISTRYKTSLNFDNEIPKSPSLTEQECRICLVEYPAFILVSSCSRGHKFCKTCLEFYVKAKISDFRGETISCPQDSCTEPCNDNILRVVLNDPEMQLFEEKKLEKAVNKNPNMRFCPQAGCSRVYTLSKATQYTICKCHSKICNACGEFWHEGKTCQQASDPGFERYIKKNGIKFCAMCKTVVQRTEGCLHMTCPVCDYEWCWSCGREYTPHHQKDCPKEWMPEPPKRVLNEKKISLGSKRTQKIIEIVSFILLIPVKLLCFGFFVCRLWKIMRETEKKVAKILIFVLAILISLGYDALIFTLLSSIIGNGNHALILLLAFVFLPFFAFIVHENLKFCFKGKFEKRWKSMNANNFRFVAPKGSVNNQNLNTRAQQNQPPPPPIQIGNVLDGIFDDDNDHERSINTLEVQNGNQRCELGDILDRIFDEDNSAKDKSIKLEDAFAEKRLPNFDHILVGIVDIEDKKELSEIKVL